MEVLGALRAAKPALPVLVLTARGEIEDRVAGLDAGAVDYLVKPFSLAELLARVRAQLRSAAQGSTTTLQAADIEVDMLSRKVKRARGSRCCCPRLSSSCSCTCCATAAGCSRASRS